MSVYRFSRRTVLPLAIVAVIAFGLHAVGASAYTKTQALRKAAAEQTSDCRWGNPVFYRCGAPGWLWPRCGPTGTNRAGAAQWLCGGIFLRVRKRDISTWECDTTYWLSPWGRVLNHGTYRCRLHPPIEMGRKR